MNKLLFVDLDDTLFNSHHKRIPTADSVPMAYLQDGSVISYANSQQAHMLKFWQQHYVMIPVTARNWDALKRVDIAFEHGAVIDYGGIVLKADGSIDDHWRQRSEASAQLCVQPLQALVDYLQQYAALVPQAQLYVRVVGDVGIDFYVLLKSKVGDTEQVVKAAEVVRQFCRDQPALQDYQIHQNSNNLAVMPPWLNKRHGVNYLLSQWRSQGEVVTFGMGDSIIDLGFMQECDYLVVPNFSQIQQQRMQT